MAFADMDKRKKITILVAGVGLVVGAVLIVNSLSGGAIKEVVAPTPKPEPPKLEQKEKEAYVRQKQQMKEAEDSGQAYSAGG